MSRLKHLFAKTLLYHLWQEFLLRYRFKYILPRVRETQLDGVRLDLSRLSLKVRNRILMGLYETHEKRLCEEFLRPDDVVLEIGAAIGFIGLLCQTRIGIKQYFAVEANPYTLDILRSNYQLNGLQPRARNLALGPDHGALELEVGTDFWENSVLRTQASPASSRTVTVPGAPLPDLLAAVGRTVNVLIIDVEGAEQFIDPETIPPEIDKIIIELHPHVLGAEKTYNLIAALIARGYYVAREESGTLAFLKRSERESEHSRRRWDAEPEIAPLSVASS